VGGRRGEEEKYNKIINIQKEGWRSRKLTKLEKGVGGSKTFPTWRGGFEVQEELGTKREEANQCERKR